MRLFLRKVYVFVEFYTFEGSTSMVLLLSYSADFYLKESGVSVLALSGTLWLPSRFLVRALNVTDVFP